MPKPDDQTTSKHDSILGLIARVFWMLLGNAILLLSIVSILQYQGRGFHTADVVFWITVAALIVVRYLDITLWGGSTSTGQPASIAHWRKYAISLLGCSTGVWALLHLIVYLTH